MQTYREFAGYRVEINPSSMLVTSRAVYAGTAGYGLAVLRCGQERWQFIGTSMPSLNVTALAADETSLYVGTDNGLDKPKFAGNPTRRKLHMNREVAVSSVVAAELPAESAPFHAFAAQAVVSRSS